jgi:NAD(P)-dependent dehydrogenase (short-subunit alcohol dehydrogenase family)
MNTKPIRKLDPIMERILNNKTAFVTGGGQGIGRGIALKLAEAGADIVIAQRNQETAKNVVGEIQLMGRKATAMYIDVTDSRSVTRCIKMTLKTNNQIDILVNNSGIHSESISRISEISDFEKCFNVNLFGVWRVTKELLSHFIVCKTGKIINIASIDGRRPWAHAPAYSASKAALINLTQSTAQILGKYNINVNAICPGGIITNIASSYANDLDNIETTIIQERAIKRPITAEDIGNAAVFLASHQSKNITGQSLNIDCGALMN